MKRTPRSASRRGQQAPAIDRGGRLVDAVKAARLGRLAGQVERFGHRGLHPIRQLVRLEAGPELGILGILLGRQAIQLADKIELVLLLARQDAGAGSGKRQRLRRVERELDAGVLRAEVIRVEVLPDPRVAILAEEDELRQILVERPEAVVDPRADDRLPFVEGVPAVVHLELGAVVVVGGVHRAHQGNVVDAAGEVRQPVANLGAALAVPAKADLQRVDAREQVAIHADDRARPREEQPRLLRVGTRRLRVSHAGVAVEGGLRIEGFEMPVAAGEKDPDHGLGAD